VFFFPTLNDVGHLIGVLSDNGSIASVMPSQGTYTGTISVNASGVDQRGTASWHAQHQHPSHRQLWSDHGRHIPTDG
jgi:hypothetical protein